MTIPSRSDRTGTPVRCHLIRALRATIRAIDWAKDTRLDFEDILFPVIILTILELLGIGLALSRGFHWAWGLLTVPVLALVIAAIVFTCIGISEGWGCLRNWTERRYRECQGETRQ